MIANVLYLLALLAASPIVLYRVIRHGRYRRGIRQKLFGLSAAQASRMRRNQPQCIWLHAVSVGEVNLLGGVVNQIQRDHSDSAILISTSTDTGYDLAVSKFGAERVFFCPLDFTWAVKRTIRHLRPKLLCLAELELWPNLIRAADENDTQVAVINGRLSAGSGRAYRRFSMFTRSTFARLHWVGCQDQSSRDHFEECGTVKTRLHVTGSLKFDDAPNSRDTVEVQRRVQWAGIDPWQVVWMVGSTQEGEERMALEIYRQLQETHPELRLILVPRHPERFDSVADLISAYGLRVHRRSKDSSLQNGQWDSSVVHLIDTIGELRDWWGVCHIATVGGSFGDRGGQNMLEPAGYGAAVSFGPNTKNFADIARRLIEAGGAVRVADQEELCEFVDRCLNNRPAADALGRSARQVVEQHRGATELTRQGINQLIAGPNSTQSKRHAA